MPKSTTSARPRTREPGAERRRPRRGGPWRHRCGPGAGRARGSRSTRAWMPRAPSSRRARRPRPRRAPRPWPRGPAVVGVLDEADHRGAHGGHRGRDRQVDHHPSQGARARGPRQPVSGEVEVGPPRAEPDDDGDESDGEGERVGRFVGQSVDHSGHVLAQHDDDEQPEPFRERVGHAERDHLFRDGPPDDDHEPDQVDDGQRTPRQHAGVRGQAGARAQHDRAGRRPCHVQQAGTPEFGSVTARGEQPQQRQHREQHPRVHGEGDTAFVARAGDERAQRDEHEDLQQEHAPAAGVLVPVQFVVQAAVEPGDPHQREHRGEQAQSVPVEFPGQMVGGLRDQYDHDQVVEEFQRPDHALARLLAMRARGLPQVAAHPGELLLSRGHARSVEGWRTRSSDTVHSRFALFRSGAYGATRATAPARSVRRPQVTRSLC